MTQRINGKPGATITDAIAASVPEPVPIVELLEKTLGQIRWRRLGAAIRDRKASVEQSAKRNK
jgi:hypothetical protein